MREWSIQKLRGTWLACALLAGGMWACHAETSVQEDPQAEAMLAEQRARSDAEVLIQLEELIAEDESRRVNLNALERNLSGALQVATEHFNRINEQREAMRDEPAPEADADAGAGPSTADLDKAWLSARDEVSRLLHRKRAVAQQVSVVLNIIEKEKEAVELITMHRVRGAQPEGTAAPSSPSPAPPPPRPSVPLLPLLRAPLTGGGTAKTEPVEKLYDPKLSEAERWFEKRANEVELAEHRVRLVEQLIALVEDDLNLARVNAKGSQKPADERQVEALENRLDGLRRARGPVEQHLREAERRAAGARRQLEFLKSPLSPERMKRWFTSAGPRIAVIVVALFLVWLLLQRMARRLASSVIMRASYASEEERTQRVDTVKRAAESGFTVGIFLISTLALLPEFGVDVAVLLGGAAVVSLAIAFGAQSLIKDYFSGITVLLENQYRVGNVVRINGLTGVVEDISLRMTTLRDLDGTAHFIAHGQITNVSNLTHGWSRVVMDVRVAYREDADRVIGVLRELGELMRTDPEFGHMIVDEPEMLGVDALSPSEVVIRFLVKTRPLKQWPVKRELLRRIKARFDALNIEIPLPQRAVHHRTFDSPIAVVTKAVAEAHAHEGDESETGGVS